MYLDKWSEFCVTWAEALKGGYGSPVTFVKGMVTEKIEICFNGAIYPFLWFFSPGHAKRGEFMERQKKEMAIREQQKSPIRWRNIGSPCFLCDNVGQAIASQEQKDIPNNLMYNLGDYLILPNRYPVAIGHSLFVPKFHDDLENRIHTLNGKFIPEKEKTRGEIMKPYYLESLIKACDDFKLIGASNHALDSMSIPYHKHFHLFPEDLKLFSLISYILRGKIQTDFGESIYKAENTPYDTLIIKRENDRDGFIEKSCSILGSMEKSNEVFTILYVPERDVLIISPRKGGADIIENVGCGNVVPVHAIGQISKEEIQNFTEQTIKRYVPMKGEYDWGRFF